MCTFGALGLSCEGPAEIFSQIGPVSVGREINFPTTDGDCGQNTHSHDTCARTAHHRTHRTDVSLTQHAWLKDGALWCL